VLRYQKSCVDLRKTTLKVDSKSAPSPKKFHDIVTDSKIVITMFKSWKFQPNNAIGSGLMKGILKDRGDDAEHFHYSMVTNENKNKLWAH